MDGLADKQRIIEKLARDMAPLMDYLHDDEINEVMLNANGQLWVDSMTKGMFCVGTLDTQRAHSIVYNLAGLQGKVVSLEHPFLEADLPLGYGLRGERFTALLPPIVARPSFTIRKRSMRIFTLNDYVSTGRLSAGRATCIRTWLSLRKNILVAGSPGSGKTTVTNALIDEAYVANPTERFFLLEDVSELRTRGENSMAILTFPPFVSMSQLLVSATRSRPDRILVGEVRGAEAHDMLKAWNIGCSGGIGTLHANGVEEAIQRVMDLCMEGGLSAPPIALMRQVLHAIIFVTRRGSQSGFITDIALVTGFKDGRFLVEHMSEEGNE